MSTLTIVVIINFAIAFFFLGVPIATAIGVRPYDETAVWQSIYLSLFFAGLASVLLVAR